MEQSLPAAPDWNRRHRLVQGGRCSLHVGLPDVLPVPSVTVYASPYLIYLRETYPSHGFGSKAYGWKYYLTTLAFGRVPGIFLTPEEGISLMLSRRPREGRTISRKSHGCLLFPLFPGQHTLWELCRFPRFQK